MFFLLKRFLGRLIMGWIMSLLVFMVQRAVKRMMTPPSHPSSHPAPPTGPMAENLSGFGSPPPKPPARPVIVRDTIWQGMSQSDLLAAYGPPALRSSETPTCEIWTYPLAETDLTVTLENGKVLSWTD